jgi:hypothetical protein
MNTTTRWPDLAAALQPLAPSPDLTVRTLREGEAPRLIALLHRWYPALAVAEVGYLLDPAFYAGQVAYGGEALAERPSVMVVAERAGELEMCVLLTAEDDGRILSGAMTVVSPAAYGRGLGGVAARSTTAVARAIGADLAYALAELDNHASRKALEAAGLSLCAVIPGSERKPTANGGVVRVAEAMYAHSLAPAITPPRAATLTPTVAALLYVQHGVEAVDGPAPAARVPARATGVDAGCRFVSLRDLDAQRAAEAEGLTLLGVIPGTDRHLVDGALTFGFEALYGRPADVEDAAWPAAATLPPRLAELVDHVRGVEASRAA